MYLGCLNISFLNLSTFPENYRYVGTMYFKYFSLHNPDIMQFIISVASHYFFRLVFSGPLPNQFNFAQSRPAGSSPTSSPRNSGFKSNYNDLSR